MTINATAPVVSKTTLSSITGTCSISQPAAPTALSSCGDEKIVGTTTVIFPLTDKNVTEITWTFTDKNGLTSTQKQVIEWTSIDATVTVEGETITANQENASYQWYKCGGVLLSGKNTQSLKVLTSGSYFVTITKDGCQQTSECTDEITISNTIDVYNTNTMSIYPNPATNIIHIESNSSEALEIYEVTGQLIFSTDYTDYLNISNLIDGIYFLKQGEKRSRFIKQ